MAVAVTFVFTVPRLPTEQMQQEKFDEAPTCVTESLVRRERKGKFCMRANAGVWENDRPSTGAPVLEKMFLGIVPAHELVYFEECLVLESCLG